MTLVLDQTHFRIRLDSTAAQGGTPTWAAALDTNYSIAKTVPFRIRITVSHTGTTDTTSVTWQLQVSQNGGTYANVPTTNAGATDATNGASANNSAITSSLIGGTGTFGAVGVYSSNAGSTSSIVVAHATFDEFEYGLEILSSASLGDTYDFRMLRNTSSFNTYTATPRLTVVAPPPPQFLPSLPIPTFNPVSYRDSYLYPFNLGLNGIVSPGGANEYGSSQNFSLFTAGNYRDAQLSLLTNPNLFPTSAPPANPFFENQLGVQFNPQSYRDTFFDGSAFLPKIIQNPIQSYLGAPFNPNSYRDSYFDSSAFLPNIPGAVANPFFGSALAARFNAMAYRDSYFDANSILPVFQPAPNPFVNVWLYIPR